MNRRAWWITGGVLALILTIGGGWLWVADSAVDHVRIEAADPRCTGVSHVNYFGDGISFRTSPEMRCRFPFDVSNTGGRAVHLDRIVAPYLGPETGAVVRARTLGGSPPTGDIDAVRDLDRTLAGGDTYSFTIVAVFNTHGCNDSGTLTFADLPQVTVSSLGHHRTVVADWFLEFDNRIRTPGCRAMYSEQ
jgi:hypothetical protein